MADEPKKPSDKWNWARRSPEEMKPGRDSVKGRFNTLQDVRGVTGAQTQEIRAIQPGEVPEDDAADAQDAKALAEAEAYERRMVSEERTAKLLSLGMSAFMLLAAATIIAYLWTH